MNFASPMFFWAFLSLIPLIAIYLLKVKPTRKPTTAFFLWENIFQEKKATSLFQRFRDLLSLLMMAFAFAAIVFALVRPDFSGDDQKDLVLLIDNSASMNSNDGGSSRLNQAKKAARQIVRALNGTQRCSVAAVSNEATFYSNLTDNPRELLDAIDKVETTSMASRLSVFDQFRRRENQESKDNDTANQTNAKEVGTKDEYRVILLSDGCIGGDVHEEIELIKIGTSNPGNAGIVACDMQRLPGGSNRVGVFFQINSSFKNTVEAELILSHGTDDNLIKLIPLEIVPGENPAEVFELENATAGKWFARIEFPQADDALPDDNFAFLTLPPRRPIPISVIADDRFFYENCVLAFSKNNGLLNLVDSTGTTMPQMMIGAGDFAVKDDANKHFLVFQPKGESPWWSDVGDEIEVTLPRVLDENHPVIRHLDPALIPFVGARQISAPDGSEIWVMAEDGTPLIYRTTRAGKSAIVVNLDPLASDFYFSAWFPVLVYSSTTHLAGRGETVHASYPTGQFASIPGAQEGVETLVGLPDESVRTTSETILGPLSETGFYQLKNSSGDWQVACSLLSPTESAIENETVKDSSLAINRGFSPVLWLTLIAIFVVVAESILYQRRRVG